MSDDRKPTAPTLLAAGGVAAAFGAASCCALPVALGAFGLGSASIAGVSAIAAPIQLPLLLIAMACLVGGVVISWRRRVACSVDDACVRPRSGRLAAIGFALTGVLTLAAVLSG